ncbi:hypothetical protein [Limosilactobacillus agrestimuris]|uniref:hypothetical protein n=1 Tax=Limosilactobacillus agrestimuris TaxID=2941331 RepID=UPI00203E3676|nr:hypothetical protein [Limosilactobacillus agrestimuris]
MDKEVKSCMIDLLRFLNSDTYKNVENLAGVEISHKYSKKIIDSAAEQLIDNGYVLGGKSKNNSEINYFETCVTDKGIQFLKQIKEH